MTNDDLPVAGACAYCGRAEAPLTKEHLWPAAFHRRKVEADEHPEWRMWTTKTGKDLKTEHTIRDVCATCNNGFLSQLDAYACRLFDKYFVRNLERGDVVDFEADYHLLKRWLLKICYNSARINDAGDRSVFAPLLPYVAGHSERVGRSVQILAVVPFPSALPPEHHPDGWPAERLFRPTANRIGRFVFRAGDRQKVLRAIHLRGFTFLLAFYDPDRGRSEHAEFTQEFLARLPFAQVLRPSRPSVRLMCDGIDAWSMFADARSTTIVQQR